VVGLRLGKTRTRLQSRARRKDGAPEIPLKFVVSTAFQPIRQLCDLARAADAAGYDMITVSDHVVHPKTIRSPYPYTADGGLRWEPFTDWADAWVTIGAMSSVTERIAFTTNVYVLPMRNPFLVAKAIATAAAISGGRVTLGIGVGWMEEEFGLLGQQFARRGKRTDEMIEVLRKIWRGGWVEHHGEFYDFDPLEMSPAPGDVPIYCGGLSKPALRRAATRCDGWVSDLHGIEDLRRIVDGLLALRADSERADRPFAVLASSLEAVGIDGHKRLAEAGTTHCLTMPWMFYCGPDASLAAKIDAIRRFADEVASKV